MPPIEGWAQADGTRAFADRAVASRHLPAAHFRPAWGGLTVSSLGLGTYLGAADGPTDRAVEEAVRTCLGSGRVNFLDTAINYRNQRAERSVGRALAGLIEQGRISREEVVVATKSGYLAPDGESGLAAGPWIERELLRPGVLARGDLVDGSHAMSVSYLADQFERSRANLGLDSLDLVYLHNAPDVQIPSVGRTRFLERLTEAFTFYERLRSAGRLRAYGLATWDSLRAPRSDPGHLSLEEAVGVARAVGGERHGFRYIQFPFHLGLPEAAVLRNQSVRGERRTLFHAASLLGLGCVTSVPLGQGEWTGPGSTPSGLTVAQEAIQFARSAPGALVTLIGQKRPEHLSENLEVAGRVPWGPEEFRTHLP